MAGTFRRGHAVLRPPVIEACHSLGWRSTPSGVGSLVLSRVLVVLCLSMCSRSCMVRLVFCRFSLRNSTPGARARCRCCDSVNGTATAVSPLVRTSVVRVEGSSQVRRGRTTRLYERRARCPDAGLTDWGGGEFQGVAEERGEGGTRRVWRAQSGAPLLRAFCKGSRSAAMLRAVQRLALHWLRRTCRCEQ